MNRMLSLIVRVATLQSLGSEVTAHCENDGDVKDRYFNRGHARLELRGDSRWQRG